MYKRYSIHKQKIKTIAEYDSIKLSTLFESNEKAQKIQIKRNLVFYFFKENKLLWLNGQI